MASEYWMIKNDDSYYRGVYGDLWTRERLLAMRYLTLFAVRQALGSARETKPSARIVRVTVRTRSERLWMARRLAKWTPIMFEAVEMVRATRI